MGNVLLHTLLPSTGLGTGTRRMTGSSASTSQSRTPHHRSTQPRTPPPTAITLLVSWNKSLLLVRLSSRSHDDGSRRGTTVRHAPARDEKMWRSNGRSGRSWVSSSGTRAATTNHASSSPPLPQQGTTPTSCGLMLCSMNNCGRQLIDFLSLMARLIYFLAEGSAPDRAGGWRTRRRSVPANAAKPHATTAAAPVALRKPVFTTIDQLRRLMATPSSPASSPPAPSSTSPPRTSADPASQSASSETKLAPSANCLLLLVDP
ncbi:hypothetical protein EJB05_03474, partial [Eragrostis curvula]